MVGPLHKLQRQLAEYEPFFAYPEERLQRVTPALSGWSVSSHLDHTLKVTALIANSIAGAQEIEGPGNSWLGKAVLFFGYIPRGKAKSPAAVVGSQCSHAELRALLVSTAAQLEGLAGSPILAKSVRLVRHPRFGVLTPAEGLRFAAVHTHHHLKIAREILAVQRLE